MFYFQGWISNHLQKFIRAPKQILHSRVHNWLQSPSVRGYISKSHTCNQTFTHFSVFICANSIIH